MPTYCIIHFSQCSTVLFSTVTLCGLLFLLLVEYRFGVYEYPSTNSAAKISDSVHAFHCPTVVVLDRIGERISVFVNRAIRDGRRTVAIQRMMGIKLTHTVVLHLT